MYALSNATWTQIYCGNFKAAKALVQELLPLAQEKGAAYWTAFGQINQGCLWALTGSVSNAVETLSSAIAAWRSTGANLWIPFFLSQLALAYAKLGAFDEASRCIAEAINAVETTKERWCEADIRRIAGEIALISPGRNAANAEAYFAHALAVARQQQAKSWELRAANSLARLWRDQRKMEQARELLAPVYDWFTEGFDTRDLKEAKALLHALS
jgi:predicted ATPase